MRTAGFVRALSLAAAVAGAVTAASAQVDRSHPPQPGPPRPLKLPAFERKALSNGLPVVLVGMHEVPVAEVILVVRAGATADPQGREGLASMTAGMLDEGAGGRDALALADAIDFLGATLEADADWDASTVSLRVPVARLSDALPIMADVALRPDFPEKELARLRKEALTALLQARDVPGRIASRELAEAVFGRAHRYGRPETGDAASISALNVAEMRAFHDERYTPAAATLVVVGDVTAESVLPLLEKAFGAWKAPAAAPAAPSVPAPPQVRNRTVWLVDKPGSVQSAIRIGRVGVSWNDPRYAATEVMNTLLGGSFTSRLNDNLREQHGYTYGARSGFARYRTGGLFVAMADVQTDKTAPALTEFVKELTRIRTAPTPEEAERARSYAALRYPEQFETTQQVAAHVVEKVVYDLPDGFFEQFVPKALAVDAAAIAKAADAEVDPRNIAIVVVGDRSKVEGPIRALNLGPIRNLTVEDVMGPAPKVD
jgi:predicted Zn-dependent peptidase